MNRARLLRSLYLSGPALVLVFAAGLSCSTTKDTEAFVPSQRGTVQPDGGGPLLSEGAACTQLKDAESSARKALGCEAVTRECPGYIRPAGSACAQYEQASVDGCVELYSSFQGCADFVLHPCLITAVSKCDAGEGGAGGAGGAPSTSGDAGNAGAAGDGAAGASSAGAGGA